MSVELGVSNIGKNGIRIRVVKFKKHPNYDDETKDYDIAILTLEKLFSPNLKSQCIALHTVKPLFFVGDATVSGWGAIGVS